MEAEVQTQLSPMVDSTHPTDNQQRCPVGSGCRRLPTLRLVCNTTPHADKALVNSTFMEVGVPKQPHISDIPVSFTPAPCPPRVKAMPERRSSRKLPPTPPRKTPLKAKGIENLVQMESGKPKRSRGPKSDTFKMAWSVEEQRLLERLLEEIPDGEKNRFTPFTTVSVSILNPTSFKGGRRFPRQ